MSHKAVVKSQSVVTKELPFKSIRVRKETNPREKIDAERVLFFQELYQTPDHKIPPLEVLLIQSEDPKTSFYLILDGVHRYGAVTHIKASKVLCNVHTEPSYTLADLEDISVQDAILEISCLYNINGNTPLTRSERIAAALRFQNRKYDEPRIAHTLGVSRVTIARWLKDTKKDEKGALKEEILEQLRNKVPVNKLARIYKDDLSEMTIMRWKKEADIADEKRGGVTNLSNDKNVTPPGGTSSTGGGLQTLTDPPPLFNTSSPLPGFKPSHGMPADAENREAAEEKQNAETTETLVKIGDLIRGLPWSDDADDMIITEFFKVLSLKSKKLKAILRTEDGLADLYEEVKSKYEVEKGLHEKTRETSLEKTATIEKLEAELTSRREHCKENCDHSKVWARKEMQESAERLMETVGDLKSVLQENRLFYGPKKAKVMTVPNEALELAGQLALNSVYITLSHFEWSLRHRLHSAKTITIFYEFLSIVESLGFQKKKDVMQRVRFLDQEFSKRRAK